MASIRTKVLLGSTLMVIVDLSVMAGIYYNHAKTQHIESRKNLDAKVVANNALLIREYTKRLESEIDNYTKLYSEKFKILYSEPDFKGFFERLSGTFSTIAFVGEKGDVPIIIGKQVINNMTDLSKLEIFKNASSKPNKVQFDFSEIEGKKYIRLLILRKSFFDEFQGGYLAYVPFDGIVKDLELKAAQEGAVLGLYDNHARKFYNVEDLNSFNVSDQTQKDFDHCFQTKSECSIQAKILNQESHVEIRPDDSLGLAMFYAVPDKLLSEAIAKIFKYIVFSATFLIGLSYFLNHLLTSKILTDLGILTAVTDKIGQGDFHVDIPVQSNDEVGRLASSFRSMQENLEEITRQKEEANRSKVRLEKEVEIAQHIQKFFFPEDRKQYSYVDIASFSMSATECRGDWFYHFENDGKYYVMIGDATGHGIGPALITSVVRGTISIIESLKSMGPAEILRILNHSIHQSAKGEILMTFFVACIDSKTGILQYANASHEIPFVICEKNDEVKTQSSRFLTGISGYALGFKAEVIYQQFEEKMNKNDLLVMYTDGVGNMRNKTGRILNERALTTLFERNVDLSLQSDRIIESMKLSLSDFYQPEESADDAAILVMKMR